MFQHQILWLSSKSCILRWNKWKRKYYKWVLKDECKCIKIWNKLNQKQIGFSWMRLILLPHCSHEWYTELTNKCNIYDLQCTKDKIMITITIIIQCMSIYCINFHVEIKAIVSIKTYQLDLPFLQQWLFQQQRARLQSKNCCENVIKLSLEYCRVFMNYECEWI